MADGHKPQPRPKALVYRGEAASPGCAESVARLLETSPYEFQVAYAGPNEQIDVTHESLMEAEVFAFPGGPDLDDAYKLTEHYKKPLQDFVAAGGHYLGFCLGAYIAGHSPGYGLLPSDVDADSEVEQSESQVTNEDDTIIQVDWTFSSGKTQKKRWLYFQEGAMIDVESIPEGQGRIIARYSQSKDVAACVTKYGSGWVGLINEVEDVLRASQADAKRSLDADNGTFENPDGLAYDIGHDFIAATLHGGRLDGPHKIGDAIRSDL